MKLHLSNPSGLNSITGYAQGYVEINHRRHTTSLAVTPQAVFLEDWAGLGFEQLNEDHFARLAQLKPEMVLLGTGAKLLFPHPRLSRALVEARIGLEVMDSGAACRTYNILMAEGRNVLALILL